MRSVLIVDDDHSVRTGLSAHVNWKKLRLNVCATAQDGKEALEKISNHQPDIVITDIYMPEMDGLELIQRINEQFPHVNAVIHSGYNHFENARKAIQYGVKHFFLKPSPVSEIEAVMQEVLQEMEAQEKQKAILTTFEKQLPQFQQYEKDQLVRDLLFRDFKRAELPVERLSIFSIDPSDSVIIATFQLNRPPYLTKRHEQDWQLIKFSVENIIQETLTENLKATSVSFHVMDLSDGQYIITLFADKAPESLEKQLDELLRKVLDNLLYYLKVSLLIGVSYPKGQLIHMAEAYQECLVALEVAEYGEWNEIYRYRDIRKENLEQVTDPFEVLKAINEAITNKNYDKLLIIWNEFKQNQFMTSPLPFYDVQTICIHTLSAILLEEEYAFSTQNKSEERSKRLKRVYDFRNTKELLDWMTDELEKVIEIFTENGTKKKTNRLTERVKEYVENYYDEDITLAEIADTLYVNKNYLSQLFKRVTGESFVNYLNNFRISKAKKLLREKKYMVYEVSEMVGYQNPTYFSQVFKAVTGCSPSEYY